MQPCQCSQEVFRVEMKNNILITSVGSRVELVQAFQSELKSIFFDANVFATDMSPLLSPACQTADDYWAVPQVTDLDYINTLLTLCLNNNIGMVVPTIDTELEILAENREWFHESGIAIIVSSKELVAECRDKRKTRLLFDRIGVTSPNLLDKNNLSFPCFAKPYNGSCSVGATPLYDKTELTSKILNDKKMMFMELVDEKHIEYTVDAYYAQNGSLKCMVPRERIAVRAGEVNKGVTRKHEVYDYLLPACNEIKGARGCLTIQIFADLDRGSFYGLEINPRFGGGFPLSYSASANYPRWLIYEYFLGDKIEFYDKWEKDLLMLRYDAKELVHGYE
jgi:carbamoyl-phosphate synthase large subunit